MAIERIGLTTEYKADGLGETKPVLRIGGKTEKFVPNVNASFSCETGTEKYWYNINANSVIVDKQTEILASDSVSLKVGDTTEQYVVEKYYGQECLKWKRIFDKHPVLLPPVMTGNYQHEQLLFYRTIQALEVSLRVKAPRVVYRMRDDRCHIE